MTKVNPEESSERQRDSAIASPCSPSIGSIQKSRRLISICLLIVLGACFFFPARQAVHAVQLMLALKALSSGDMASGLPVLQEKIALPKGSGTMEGISYRPAGEAPERAILMVPGISELGCYHPRLMALCRSLADKGFLVITPDIREFREFEMPPEAIDQIVFWFGQIPGLPGAGRVKSIGMGGISFSGTLSLIASTRPGILGRPAWVLAIGPYDDPLRCSRDWFAPGPITVSPGYFPTRFYAKWILMLAALDMLSDPMERELMRATLKNLLLQKEITTPQTLSAEGRRWRRMALLREDESDPELAGKIQEFLAPRLYSRITPFEAAAEIRCPVFLVHGAFDDLIPPEESRRLKDRIKQARAYLLISPFLTHTHPMDKPLSWSEKASGIASIFSFFYSFSGAAF